MADNNHLVIMAGGIGSRLYPMSTLNCPKQFIDVLGCGKRKAEAYAGKMKGNSNNTE